MIRLEKFKVFGFKDKEKFAEVNFSKGPISVIYGANGSGKTSFLKVISAFLSQDDQVLNSLSVKEIRCTYSQDGEFNEVCVGKTEISYDWSALLYSPLKDTRSLALGVERGISTQSLRVAPSLIYEFLRRTLGGRKYSNSIEYNIRELSEDLALFIRRQQNQVREYANQTEFSKSHENINNIKMENIEELLISRYRKAKYTANLRIQSALFTTLSDALDSNNSGEKYPIPKDFYESIINYRLRMIEALSDEDSKETNQFKKKIIEILGALTADNYVSEIEKKPLLLSLFSNMIRELVKEKLALGFVNLLIDTFNNYLIDDKKLVVSNSEIYISIGENKHSIHDLSSGERHILTFLSLVLFQGQDRDFLIIDEPEISLNIVWQRQLMDLFSKLVPKTQIIVASHSPVIAGKNTGFLTPLRTKKVV